MSRAERRRHKREQLKQEKRQEARPTPGGRRLEVGRDIFAQGIEPGSSEAKIIEDQASGTIEMLGEDGSIERTIKSAEVAAAAADEIIAALPAPPRPLACEKGCYYCCYLKINASIPEVLAIASHLQAHAGDDELTAVRSRIHSFLERTQHLTGDDRMMAREPCPLLVEGCCSVYPLRPLTCRGWNSFHVTHCRQDFEHPEARVPAALFRPQLQAARSVLAGTEAGLACLRVEHESIDLVAGLEIGLNAPVDTLQRRWRAGEPVFRQAEDDTATQEAANRWTEIRPWPVAKSPGEA